jgi:DNA-directed RNA polymerase subunit E"
MKPHKLKACLNCKYLTEGDKCPLCGSTDLTTNWQDVILIVDTNSKLAEKTKIKKEGMFALFIK